MDLLDEVLSGVYKHHPDNVRDDLRTLANDRLISEATRRRRADEVLAGKALRQVLADERAIERLNGHAPEPEPVAVSIELDQLLAEDEPDHEWLVPGLFERSDRTIFTGLEGGGKSTLIRQMCVQFAIGAHPFGGPGFEPISSLIVDVENSRRQVRRKIRALRETATNYDPFKACVQFEFRTDGLNLLDEAAVNWLDSIMARNGSPDLLAIGPVYKLAYGDPTREETALAVATALDRVRKRHNCAVLLEAHTPYSDGKSKRPVRPYGASLWSRWPEFGIYLSPDGKLEHWRGARDEREWPAQIERGAPWPWMPSNSTPTTEWDGPTACMEAVVALMADGQSRSKNQILSGMRATGHGFRDVTVGEAAERLALKGQLAVKSGARNSRIYSLSGERNLPDEPF